MEITTPYYQDNSRISNSSLGWFMESPKYFRQRLDGKIEGETSKAMDKGTMIHMYLLQPDDFWKNYEILDFETPSSAQQKQFAETYAASKLVDPILRAVEALSSAYSVKGKSEDKMATEGLEMASKLDSYIKYLAVDRSKAVISWSDLNMLKTIKENVRIHKKANELLLTVDNSPFVKQLSEFHINWEYPKHHNEQTILCKSLLDRVYINHETKKILLIDIKTTSSIKDFKSSVDKYDYYRQMSYYWIALTWYFKNELNIDIDEYTADTYIVAIQSNGDYSVKVFKLNNDYITAKIPVIDTIVNNISYHMHTNSWEFSKNYYEGDGSETLE